MNKLDDLIKEALSEEDQSILDNTNELGWFALGRSQFSGTYGWVTWVIMITQALMFFVGLWAAWNCYVSVEALSAIKWAALASTLITLALVLKLSLMPQMQADRILRELKRVELLIAHSKS